MDRQGGQSLPPVATARREAASAAPDALSTPRFTPETCLETPMRFAPLALILFAPAAFAANSDTHTVTVTVEAINELAISGGNVSMTINSATAGSNPNAVSDAITSIDWTTNEDLRKVTVETNLLAPVYDLTVQATGVVGGTSPGVVALSTIGALDFITGISAGLGSATLSYGASALAADGTGQDVHTVTYTITAN